LIQRDLRKKSLALSSSLESSYATKSLWDNIWMMMNGSK
jgi:hypothetical protein